MAVAPLKRGRSEAKESVPVGPVSPQTIELTKAHLPPTVATMIDLQQFTGMRPGEVCIMRAIDIDRSDKRVWIYTPHTHKLEHKSKQRRIPLGPRAQKALQPFLDAATSIDDAYLFSPAQAQAERLASKAAAQEDANRLRESSRDQPRLQAAAAAG